MSDVRMSSGDEIGNASRMTSQIERDSMPAATVNKAMLAIVADSIEVSFTKFGGNLWKYDSSASRPTLAPLASARTSGSEVADDISWKSYYDQLLSDLPSDVSTRLSKESNLPKEERNDAYTALNNVLQTVAKTLASVASASNPVSADSAAFRHSLAVSLMGAAAEKNISASGKEFLNEANNYLNSVGSNYVHFDKLSTTLKQTDSSLNRMDNLGKEGS